MSDPARGALAVVAVAALLTGCGDSAGGGARSGSPAADSAPRSVTVEIKDFRFTPASVRVAQGGTVTFVNRDDSVHTATLKPGFDTGPLALGASKAVTVSTTGTLDYLCDVHQYMKGSLEVVAG